MGGHRWLVALFGVCACLFSPPLPASAPARVESVLAQVGARYGQATSLTAEFVQQDTTGGGVVQRGRVTLKEPGLMRWDYREPSERLFVCDGRQVWMWTPALNQVVHYGAADPRLLGHMYDLLHGLGSLREAYQVSLGPASEGVHRLVLVPREPGGAFASVGLSFDRTTLDLVEAAVTDALGNVSTTRFTRIRLGAAVDGALFHFTPPPGAEVIEAG